MNYQYLFGNPVIRARPSATGQRKVFLIGAYPSALHVRWSHSELTYPISAVAVDSEPEPFWTGSDERERIAHWRESILWKKDWGDVQPCGSLNGSSGVWVHDNVLRPLHIQREDIWMTDCLDFYCESVGAQRRTQSLEVQKLLKKHSIPPPSLHPHPDENAIVSLARQKDQDSRIRNELLEARPELLITLGNAALRVIREIVGGDGSPLPQKLSPSNEDYGSPIAASFEHVRFELLPLAHPASPNKYQTAHNQWIESKKAGVYGI